MICVLRFWIFTLSHFFPMLLQHRLRHRLVVLTQPRLKTPVANWERLLRLILILAHYCRPRILSTICATHETGYVRVQRAFLKTLAARKPMLVVLRCLERCRISTRRAEQIEVVVELQKTSQHIELDTFRLGTQLVLHRFALRLPVFFGSTLAMLLELDSLQVRFKRDALALFGVRLLAASPAVAFEGLVIHNDFVVPVGKEVVAFGILLHDKSLKCVAAEAQKHLSNMRFQRIRLRKAVPPTKRHTLSVVVMLRQHKNTNVVMILLKRLE